jgi:hypothetical protein
MTKHALTQRPVDRDDTTRYLCAAAHLDEKFTDNAIREFLVEPTRPVAPSPGTDATAVLGEAIAARLRRKYRDAVLAVLAIVAIVFAPTTLLMAWLVLALALALPAMAGQVRSLAGRNSTSLVLLAVGIGAVVLLLNYVDPQLFAEIFDSTPSRSSRSSLDSTGDETAALTVGLIMIAGMLGVLLTDRIIVWRHLTTRFSRTAGPIADPLTSNRSTLNSSPTFMNQLRRVANAERRQQNDGVPLVVHRGYSPFVGAGFEYEPWSIAVPLQPITGKEQRHLTTDALYTSISESLTGLGHATPLTPGKRLGTLRITEQVIVPADELIDHLAEPATRMILPRTDGPPSQVLTPADAAGLRAGPEEWARYYLCVQVETWDRDLVITVFVHAAMDETTMYVEWTPCVLLPIKDHYQETDQLPPGPFRPVMNGVADLLRLPATILPRIGRLVSTIRALPRQNGTLDPRMYGSRSSLREMAADDSVRNYFQLADIDRYLKILNSRFVPAVGRLLQESGYSARGFVEQAVSINNRNVYIGGSVTGNVNLGDRSRIGNVNIPKESK